MKKSIFLAIALFSAGAFLHGQSFTVTSPAADEEWCIGGTHVIRWRSSGIGGEVAIKLRPEAGSVITIKSSLVNSGSFSWTIPATVPPGRYRVRVRTVSEDPYHYDDSDLFTIKNCPAPAIMAASPSSPTYRVMPSIKVTFPDAGAKLYKGANYTLRWWSAAVAGPVAITLRRTDAPEGEPWQNIVANTENDGAQDWLVPRSLELGEYRIRVSTVSASPRHAAKSPPFTIHPAVGIGTVIPTPIETLTLPVNFRIKMTSWEQHSIGMNPIPNPGIDLPPTEFVVGYRTSFTSRTFPGGFAYRWQVFRGTPMWDAIRLRSLVGKTLTYASLSFRHKKTECVGNAASAYPVCLARAYFYSGRMGEQDPPPYQTVNLPVVAQGGTYRINLLDMMRNWLHEEEPGYGGEEHNYRIEFAGPDESQDSHPHSDEQCLSWFDNGVLTINYTD